MLKGDKMLGASRINRACRPTPQLAASEHTVTYRIFQRDSINLPQCSSTPSYEQTTVLSDHKITMKSTYVYTVLQKHNDKHICIQGVTKTQWQAHMYTWCHKITTTTNVYVYRVSTNPDQQISCNSRRNFRQILGKIFHLHLFCPERSLSLQRVTIYI